MRGARVNVAFAADATMQQLLVQHDQFTLDLKNFTYPSRFFADLAERYDSLFETRNDYDHPRGQTMASLRHR
jgi:hypothetical protein